MKKYPILDIAQMGLEQQSLEQLGTKAKRWFISQNGQQYLFKIGRPGTGENWAEKAACELCHLLGIPHAKYDFALNASDNGVLSPSFITKPALMLHGNVLLHRFRDNNANVYKHRHHTILRVHAMTELAAPPDTSLPSTIIKNGADVYAGYLMFDAWIGNQDRHDQNWGVIATPPIASSSDNEEEENNKWPLRLAPTCDQASSLGRELSDEERKNRLGSKDKNYTVAAYASRSRSALFLTPTGQGKPLSTLDAFQHFAKKTPVAASFWLDRLLSLNAKDTEDIFSRMPDSHMSETAKEFALKMLDINKASLRDLKERLT
jgi:hypothetical protein